MTFYKREIHFKHDVIYERPLNCYSISPNPQGEPQKFKKKTLLVDFLVSQFTHSTRVKKIMKQRMRLSRRSERKKKQQN